MLPTPRVYELRAVVIGTLLLVSCAPVASGAERRLKVPILEGSDVTFSRVSFGTGFSHTGVRQIVQDDLGFLWFGTLQGLQRFDGYDLRPFRPDPNNPESLSGNFVRSLFKDRSGSLWIASDQSLDRYDPKREAFVHYTGTAGSDRLKGPVYHISQDRDGILWVSTDQGLNRLDPATGRITRYSHVPSSPGTLTSNLVRAALEDKNGTFWVASPQGLDVFDRKQGKMIHHLPFDFNPGAGAISLFEDRAGVLWLTFWRSFGIGFAALDRETEKFTQYETGERKTTSGQQSVGSIYEDPDGILWLGTQGGLLKLNRERTRFTRYRHNAADPSSLSGDTVLSLFEDREGTIWVGTSGGVNRFARKPPPFRIYRHVPSKPQSLAAEDYVMSIFEDTRGTLWVGTHGALNEITRNASSYSSHRFAGREDGGLSNPSVLSIAEDPSGNLWFGTFGGGLNRFDPRSRQIQVFQHDPARNDSLSHEYASSLYVDRKGTLWVGTDKGLDRFDPKLLRFERFRPDVQALPRYHSITEDRHGNLWLASWGAGLHRFEPATGKFAVYMHRAGDSNSLSNDRVNSICVDREGILWVGASNGLNRFDPETRVFRAFYERDGLPDNSVLAILEDRHGNLWMSTGNGLSRYDRSRNVFRNYSVADGLPGNEFSLFPAAWKGPSGEMFFGSHSGAVSFFPDQVADDHSPPPVVLTDFRLFGSPVPIRSGTILNESISTATSLTLPPSQNMLSFEFAALSFRSPERNRYRFRLEPLENRWNGNERDSTRRFVTYTTLAPGDYVFRVQGSNSLGVWNTTGASVQIRVLGPWWTWWWVRAAFLLVTLTAMMALYRFRVRRLAYQLNLRFEERMAERTRIARELHDTLLQSFHGVMFRFQAVRNMLPRRPEEAIQALDTALEQTEQAIAEGRDAIQDIRSGPAVQNDLAQLLTATGQELARSQGDHDPVTFRVTVEGEPQDLSPIVRDEVYRMAREVLRNAFRHARARQIEAEIRYDDRSLRLRIRDDGKGIDPGVLEGGERPGHWGLVGIRERAKRIGAQLDFWSEAGAGTEVELTVPASVAYAKSADGGGFRLFRKRTGTHAG